MQIMHTSIKATIGFCLLFGLAACSSPSSMPHDSFVGAAYQTSGIVTIPPYTRTIFSTTNF